MALVIAGERSGVGKTTVTLSLLAALRTRSDRVQSFKVGPDYIDPMFHSHVTGRACRNLDPVLTSEAYVQQCFTHHSQTADYALVEGVMGLFDGAGGVEDFASTAHIARLLNLPILLVLDCSRMSRSIAAIAHGYKTFDPRLRMAGLVLNRVGSDRHLELLKAALEPLQIPILGVLRRQDDITIPDRHLGLIPTEELTEFQHIIDQLTQVGHTCFDWEQLLPLLAIPASLGEQVPLLSQAPLANKVRIGVARDRAFNFYYADNLDILEHLGAELVFWSPIEDADLPPELQGLYFGGGFPEVFAAELAANKTVRHNLQQAIQAGLPTYAECGGLMYLCQQVTNFAGESWPMVGVLPTTAVMGNRLTLGYRRATAQRETPLVAAQAEVWGHEFHRSSLANAPTSPLYHLQGYQSQAMLQPEGWALHQLHASYVHLHFGAKPDIAHRFLQHCWNHSAELLQ